MKRIKSNDISFEISHIGDQGAEFGSNVDQEVKCQEDDLFSGDPVVEDDMLEGSPDEFQKVMNSSDTAPEDINRLASYLALLSDNLDSSGNIKIANQIDYLLKMAMMGGYSKTNFKKDFKYPFPPNTFVQKKTGPKSYVFITSPDNVEILDRVYQDIFDEEQAKTPKKIAPSLFDIFISSYYKIKCLRSYAPFLSRIKEKLQKYGLTLHKEIVEAEPISYSDPPTKPDTDWHSTHWQGGIINISIETLDSIKEMIVQEKSPRIMGKTLHLPSSYIYALIQALIVLNPNLNTNRLRAIYGIEERVNEIEQTLEKMQRGLNRGYSLRYISYKLGINHLLASMYAQVLGWEDLPKKSHYVK